MGKQAFKTRVKGHEKQVLSIIKAYSNNGNIGFRVEDMVAQELGEHYSYFTIQDWYEKKGIHIKPKTTAIETTHSYISDPLMRRFSQYVLETGAKIRQLERENQKMKLKIQQAEIRNHSDSYKTALPDGLPDFIKKDGHQNYDEPDDMLKCMHCGYQWVPKAPSPKRCPKCKQDWRKPRIQSHMSNIDKCFLCGRELIGRGTKDKIRIHILRQDESFNANDELGVYVCRSAERCRNPELVKMIRRLAGLPNYNQKWQKGM